MAGRDASAPEGRHDAGNLVRRRLRADIPRFSFRPIPDDDYPVDACGQTGRRGLASGLRLLKSSRLRAGPAGGTCGSHRLRAGPAGRIACGRGLRAASPAGGTCRSHRLRAGPAGRIACGRDLQVASPAGGACGPHRLRAGHAGRIACGRGLQNRSHCLRAGPCRVAWQWVFAAMQPHRNTGLRSPGVVCSDAAQHDMVSASPAGCSQQLQLQQHTGL